MFTPQQEKKNTQFTYMSLNDLKMYRSSENVKLYAHINCDDAFFKPVHLLDFHFMFETLDVLWGRFQTMRHFSCDGRITFLATRWFPSYKFGEFVAIRVGFDLDDIKQTKVTFVNGTKPFSNDYIFDADMSFDIYTKIVYDMKTLVEHITHLTTNPPK